MRTFWLCVLLVLGGSPSAWAFDKASRPLGLGVEIGDPTGLSAKYYLERQIAVQAGFGFFGWPSGGGIHVDLLYEFPDAVNTRKEEFDLPIFFGAGVKAGGFVDCRRTRFGDRCDTDAFAGLRVPVGAAMQLKRTPLEIQLEFVPVFYSRFLWGFGLEADLALAARYYF